MIATSQSEGSLAAINVARMVMTMPLFVIAQAIATAALPTFAAQVARGEVGEMRSSLAATLRGVILLSLPATVGLILLRQPIIQVLFQRGEFTARSTDMVAWALLWYTAGLLGHSFVEILSRAFYALHDTKTPVIVGTVAMGLNVIFSFGFAWIFNQIGWMPHGGLALANSFATALEGAALFVLMRKRMNGIEGKSIADGTLRVSLASLGMAIGVWLWIQVAGGMSRWVIALGGVAVGGVIYLIAVTVLRVPEIQMVMEMVTRRLHRSPSSQ
jgi:putative peptidoglycan lipid II flippase